MLLARDHAEPMLRLLVCLLGVRAASAFAVAPARVSVAPRVALQPRIANVAAVSSLRAPLPAVVMDAAAASGGKKVQK